MKLRAIQLTRAATNPVKPGSAVEFGCAKLARILYPWIGNSAALAAVRQLRRVADNTAKTDAITLDFGPDRVLPEPI